MDDVIVTATEKNSLSINRKSKLTMLHSINDVLISNLGVRSLKVFCTSVGIYGQRNKGKYDVCSAIVKAKLDTNFVENKDKIMKKEGKKDD